MSPISKKNFNLVLVENDDNDVFFIERALRKAGLAIPVTRLLDGQEAIDYFENLGDKPVPDLVLLDVQMPRRTGFEVLEWLRQRPAFAKVPVMIFSSSDDPGDLRRARELGANDFLTKRTSCDEVIRLLERLTPGQG